MKVAITGGTGFVGPAVIEEMLRAGHHVVVLEHKKPVPVGPHTRLERAKGDVTKPSTLREAFAGCDAVAHLVAIIRETPSATFEKIHVQGTRNVVEAAREAGVKRFLLMSANGVDSGVETPYFRTKREMERIVKEAGFEWTLFRPSYIAGSAEGGFDDQFVDIVDKAPALPSFGRGDFEIQPVSRKDVGLAFARALDRPVSIGKTYTLVGPERMTWKEYLHKLKALRHRHKPIVYAPQGGVTLLARMLGPAFPATPDQLRMMFAGNVGDASEATRDLDLPMERWEDAVSGFRR